jgi:hypothetical protein
VPHRHGQLAGDDGGAKPDAIFDHLQHIGSLVWGERPEQEIVHHDDLHASPACQEPGEASLGAGDSDLVVQAWPPQVEGGVSAADGCVGQSAGHVRLAEPGRPTITTE